MTFSFIELQDIVIADLYEKFQSNVSESEVSIKDDRVVGFPTVDAIEWLHDHGNSNILDAQEKALKELLRLGYLEQTNESSLRTPPKRGHDHITRSYEISAKGLKYVEDQLSKGNEIISKRLTDNDFSEYGIFTESQLSAGLSGYLTKKGGDPFEGIGKVEVSFLGKKFLIGCEEGKEDETKEIIKLIELDTGETLKAVTAPLDDFRALLMGSVLTVKEKQEIPASDRIVELNDNQKVIALEAIDTVIEAVRGDNEYGSQYPEDKEQRLAELTAGKKLLEAARASISTVDTVLIKTLAYLSGIGVAVEQIADAMIKVKTLLGL